MLEIRGTLLQIPAIDAVLLCYNSDFLALHGVLPSPDSRGALKLEVSAPDWHLPGLGLIAPKPPPAAGNNTMLEYATTGGNIGG
jgi:hypothetical protein